MQYFLSICENCEAMEEYDEAFYKLSKPMKLESSVEILRRLYPLYMKRVEKLAAPALQEALKGRSI